MMGRSLIRLLQINLALSKQTDQVDENSNITLPSLASISHFNYRLFGPSKTMAATTMNKQIQVSEALT